MHFHYTSLRAILILSSHTQLAIPSSPFPSGFPSIQYIFSPPKRPTLSAHIVLLRPLFFKFCNVDLCNRQKINVSFRLWYSRLNRKKSVEQILERSKVHFRPPCDGECVGLWGEGGRGFSVIISRLQQHKSAVIC